jgi:hypothetical protein
MIYNIQESLIDGNGENYICGMLEEPKLENGVWNGCKGFNITNNHKRQTATVSTFVWLRGAPAKWEVKKVLKNEVVSVSEIERVLKESEVIQWNG